MADSDKMRLRARRKLIKVTFPNGKSFCYKNVTSTMIDSLIEIGHERFKEIPLVMCHLPLLSQEVYPKYKEWMKPVCNGWYLNAQSNTDTKYLQMRAISDALGLGLEIEIGSDLEPAESGKKEMKGKSKDKLLVKFPDGEYIANDSSLDTFLQTIWKLGIDDIARRDILWTGRPLISTYKTNNSQVQVGPDRWVTAPTTTKDRYKLLRVVSMYLRVNLEITII